MDGFNQRPHDASTQSQGTNSATDNSTKELLPAPRSNYRWAIRAIIIANTSGNPDAIQLKGDDTNLADFGPIPTGANGAIVRFPQPVRLPKDKALRYAALTGQSTIYVSVLAYQEEAN